MSTPDSRVLAVGVATGAVIALALRELFYKPRDERLTNYTHSPDFPPRDIGDCGQKVAQWYDEVFAATPMLRHDPQQWTPREAELLDLSAMGYIQERRTGKVSCEEYVRLLVRRVRLYRYMNQWTYRSYDRFERAIEAARALDVAAATAGIEAIADDHDDAFTTNDLAGEPVIETQY